MPTQPRHSKALEGPQDAEPLTSVHIRRAHAGDAESVAWVVSRFSPYVRFHARKRMAHLWAVVEEDDLVHEVWLRVLPNLRSLTDRSGKWTPVLLRYLGTTMLRYANDLYRRELRRRTQREGPTIQEISMSAISANVTNALSLALRNEVSEKIMESLAQLSEIERGVFLQRAMEGLRNDDIAAQTGESKQTISMRYTRALAKLRTVMPDGLFDHLDDLEIP